MANLISSKQGNWGKFSKAHCGIIAYVINIQKVLSGIIWDDISYLLSKWTNLKSLENFKMAAILRS